jgi:cytochrome d ubiquinol oxidase subunit I
MALAAYLATGFGAAALHALALLRANGSTFHQKGLRLALCLAIPAALLQPLSGHRAGRAVAAHQPIKLAALEQLATTRSRAPITVGPWQVPAGLSLLAFGRADAVVRGLDEVPPEDRPPAVVRPAFQLMVALGLGFVALSLWALGRVARGRPIEGSRPLLVALALAGPLGFVAIEAGWVVTEVGRQPWIVQGLYRTADAVTPTPGLWAPFCTFALVYLGLSAAVVTILSSQLRDTLAGAR